jgi:hypothetical protein
MAQANVYTSVSSQAWYTDKCRIATGANAVTFNVSLEPDFASNIYSAPTQVPAYSSRDIYVGVGNQLTITGSGYTAQELGTQSSGTAAVQSIPDSP